MVAIPTKLLKALIKDPEWDAKLEKAATLEEVERVLTEFAEAIGHPEWVIEVPAPRARLILGYSLYA